MAFCNNCQHQSPPTSNKLTMATKRLWCPTWLGGHKGPIDLCDECAKNFMPEHNSANGSWHWGEEADKMFASVEANIPYTDERFQNVCGMLENATKLHSIKGALHDSGLYVCDGKVWLLTRYNALRLGDMDTARQNFPKLFEGK